VSRRFRYYALPAGAAEPGAPAVIFRVEAGQDYETFESLQDGRWVRDNAAYEYVHGSAQARHCETAEAHRLVADMLGPEEADRLVPQRSG